MPSLSSRFLDPRLASASASASASGLSTTNLFSELSTMSPRSFSMANNPLMRRSYATLMARPLSTTATQSTTSLPGFRSMSTYQPSRMQPLSWITTPQRFSGTGTIGFGQYRSFGTGGVSRDLLANREASANRNPNSASAQNSFYQLLLKANMPAIVVERYQSGGCPVFFLYIILQYVC